MTAPVTVACIHGVNHGPTEREVFHLTWGAHLHRGAGTPTLVERCPWSSLDSFLLDGLASYLVPGTFEGHLEELTRGIEGAPGLWRIVHEAPGPVALLTHSWGCVLGYVLKARLPWLRRVPMIAMGSPHTHQQIGTLLRWYGRVPAWPDGHGPAPVFVQNRDDKIVSLSRWLPPLPAPRGCRIAWCEADDEQRQGATQEHEPWQYMRSDAFRAVAQNVLGGLYLEGHRPC